MNGLQLAQRLKDIYGKTNVIFVTGHSKYAAEEFAMNLGRCLLKPVSASEVARVMENLRYPVSC